MHTLPPLATSASQEGVKECTVVLLSSRVAPYLRLHWLQVRRRSSGRSNPSREITQLGQAEASRHEVVAHHDDDVHLA